MIGSNPKISMSCMYEGSKFSKWVLLSTKIINNIAFILMKDVLQSHMSYRLYSHFSFDGMLKGLSSCC